MTVKAKAVIIAAAVLASLGTTTSLWITEPPPPNKKLALLQAQCNTLHNSVMAGLAQQGHYFKAGEAQRTKQQAAWNAKAGTGVANSAHIQSVAWDYYRVLPDGTLSYSGEDYKLYGETWKQAGTQLALETKKRGKIPEIYTNWGGDFVRLRDYVHISCTTRQGIK